MLMKKNLRVAVLSDTHFTTDPEASDSFCWNIVRCTQSLQSLPRLRESLQNLAPDLILHLGDFTNDGSREAYEAGMAMLADVGVPVFVVRGNHDIGPVQQCLADDNGCTDRTFIIGCVRFILLDSCVRAQTPDSGAPDDRRRMIQADQLRWMEEILQQDPETLTVIASHFPLATRPFYPVAVNPDREPVNGLSAEEISQRLGCIGNRETVWALIRRYAHVRLCLAGHWHINEIIRVAGTMCVITSSICEYPCQFRLLTFGADAITVETYASGVDPLTSYVAANKNRFPRGTQEDRCCVFPLSDDQKYRKNTR